MPLVLKDRVQETTTTTGTGTVTLAGAVVGFQSFSVIGDGNTTYYTITSPTDFEVGIGTYTASGTLLSRDTILESSNSGSAVDFGAGVKTVFVTYPAEKASVTFSAGSRTANYTASINEGVLTDTSAGAFTITLPASPLSGSQVVVADSGNSWGTNNLTIARNGSTINGLAENLVCDISGVSVTLVYDGATWEVYTQIGGNGGTAVTLDGTQTLTNKTVTNLVFDGNYTEEVFTITDGASVDIDPANGTVQVWTIADSRSPTATNFASGQSVTLLIDDGTAYAITWPSVTWKTDGGDPPTLNTSGFTVIQLWKVSTVLYGARVGDA
jgi:hypothetical protein